MQPGNYIIGAGMTGLSAGIASRFPIFEAAASPGGICASYYVRPGGNERLWHAPEDGEAYRFEVGGGHWIFGGDAEVLRFIELFALLKRYARRSSVFLPARGALIPYPLQYHLGYLGDREAEVVIDELRSMHVTEPVTMADWMRHLGPTLNRLFFASFQDAYTAGLWTSIAPQDYYKTPVDLSLVEQGAKGKAPATGYNAEFVYPTAGLEALANGMAGQCRVYYGKRLVRVDVHERVLHFEDGMTVPYHRVYATLPLNHMVAMCGIRLDLQPDPHTSVLVLNIGARRGANAPDDHWIYLPTSRSGFHRVGFYGNVDTHFLPKSVRDDVSHTSLYVERAFRPGDRPGEAELERYKHDVVEELTDWGFIDGAEAVDATWIEVAYTWRWPGSTWREEALEALRAAGIRMIGRFARWHFQGIAASLREGLAMASSLEADEPAREMRAGTEER